MKLKDAERVAQRKADEDDKCYALLRRGGRCPELRICPGNEVHLQAGKWEVVMVATPKDVIRTSGRLATAAIAVLGGVLVWAIAAVMLGIHQ